MAKLTEPGFAGSHVLIVRSQSRGGSGFGTRMML